MFKTLVDLLKHLTDLEDELNEYEDNAPNDLIIEYNETEEQVEDEAEDNVKEFKNEAIEKIKLLLKRLDNI